MTAGTKAEAARQKFDEAEKIMKGNASEIQKSKVGQKIPTQIQNVTFYDLLKYTWVAALSLDLAMVLIIEARSTGSEKFKTIITILKYLFLLVGMVADFGSLFIFGTSMHNLFKFLFVTKIAKTFVSVFALFLSTSGTFMKICSVIFGVLMASIDFLFVYYLSLYLNRLDQDEYNEYGIPISDSKV